MPWGLAVTAAVGLYGANKQAGAAKEAGKAGQAAADAGIAEQRAAREQFQQNISPYLQSGAGALGTIGALNAGDFGSFTQSPDYQFAMTQGLQGLDRTAAARGGVSGGGADADRIAFASGLASQNYGDYYNRLYNLATMGQNAAVGAGSQGQQSASNIGSLLGQGAAAQGAGAIGQANAWSNAASGLAGLAGQYFGSRGQSQPAIGVGSGGTGLTYTAPTSSTGGSWMNAYGYGG